MAIKREKARRFLLQVLRYLVPLGLLVAAGAYFVRSLVVKDVISEQQVDSASNLSEASGLIAGQLKLVAADIRYLSRLEELRQYLDDGSLDARRHLEREFVAFADEYRYYDQIRLLGTDGHEWIRVNFSDGKAVLVPEAELQDKSDRGYYRESVTMNAGDVYLSPLDLNVEQGKIQIPHKPVIRLATPVADRIGAVRGYLVLNLLGSAITGNLQLGFSGSDSGPMLLNHDGYWLSAPDPAKEWGFLLGSEERFGRDYPEVWAAMTGPDAGTSGSVVGPGKGLFCYRVFSPARTVAGESGKTVKGTDDWYLVAFVSEQKLEASAARRLDSYRYVLVVVAAFVLIVPFVRAYLQFDRDEMRRVNAISARVMETPAAAIIIMDPGRNIISVNNAFRSLTGYEKVTAAGSGELFPPLQFRTLTVAAVWDSVFAWGRYEGEATLTRSDGLKLQVWASIASVAGSAGQTEAYVMILSDISEIIRLNQQIESQNSFLRILLETMPAPVYFKDANLRYRGCNPAFASSVGRRVDEIVGRTAWDVFPPDEAETFEKSDRELIETGSNQVLETKQRFANGVFHDVVIHKGLLHKPDGTPDGIVGIIFDVTERKRMERSLKEQADRDPLTGVLNRRRLWEASEHEIQRSRRYGHPLTVLMIDIDRFKLVNDTFGHAAGDEVLRSMAETVRGTLRDTDLFARIGGEEFVVLLAETGPDAAHTAAERIRTLIETHPADTPAGAVRYTVSVGAASMVPADTRFDEILRRADGALYRAKEAGRNRVASASAPAGSATG